MINHAPPGYACPFCSLLWRHENAQSESVDTDVVYHGASVTAFVSSHQWSGNPGNTLVIPNEHFENIYELPASVAAQVQELVGAVALAMKSIWQCDGVSTRQHNEPAGNQDVWHYHVHVTPRYLGDGFYAGYHERKALMPVAERARYARALAGYFRDWRPVLIARTPDSTD